jgi:hypothetical protein
MSVLQRAPRRLARLAPIALAAAAAAVLVGTPGGPPPGGAVDRYQAGEAAIVRSAVPAGGASTIRERGLAHARALGVPTGAATRLSRLRDRFSGAVLDEVVTSDARGRRLGLVRLAANGRLATAIRLGWSAPSGGRIDAARAIERATALATGAGIAGPGTPHATPTADKGWRVAWERSVGGTPVPGDGTTITLFADGTFHAAVHRERQLATAPATTLDRGTAERLARERLGVLLGSARGQARIVGARLAWVAPNDTFDASAPDAPDPVLRLAWVVEARTVAPLAERLRALELYLDAGDGTLLGGDLLR